MLVGNYHNWDQKKIKGIINYYGHQFFFGKKILDLGCGQSDLCGILHRLGGDVTAVDAQQNHLKMISKKYDGIKIVQADLDKSWPFFGKKFDIIINIDLLCHLKDFESHLKSVCASTHYLILETAVIDSSDSKLCVVKNAGKNAPNSSFNGFLSQISVANIERVLIECGMNFKRLDSEKFNAEPYIYNWVSQQDGNFSENKRRLWFCTRDRVTQSSDAINQNMIPPTSPNIIIPKTQIITSRSPTPPPRSQAAAPTNVSVVDKDFDTPSVSPDKKPIKTALCISGHLRTFQTNYQSIVDNLLSQLDCDVFIHTWDTLGLPYRHLDVNVAKINTENLEDLIQRMYNPKKIVVEPNKNFPVSPLMESRVIDFRDIPGILSMYYKIEACNLLKCEYEKENNFKYDCVIRFRGDIFLEDVFPVDSNSTLSSLCLPYYGNFGGLNDQLAWGNSAVMDSYSCLYSNIEKYLSKGAPMHPEKILQFHVEEQKLNVQKVHIKYVLKRSNGLVQNNMLLEKAWGFIK